jgi:ABC-type glycerol-3-phosphate transport system substrate-binding protein
MKRKITIVTAIAMLVAATAFAAPSDQTGNNNWDQMYQYCNQAMQQGNTGNQPYPNGQAQPQGQPMSYNSGMMMGDGNYGNMMGNGSYGHMMGNMMGSVEFR